MRILLILLTAFIGFQAQAAQCNGADNCDDQGVNGSFGQSFKINTTYALDPCSANEGCMGLLWTDYRYYRVGADDVTRRFQGSEYSSVDATASGKTDALWAYQNNPGTGTPNFDDEIGGIDDLAGTGPTALSAFPASRIPNDVTLYGWFFDGTQQLTTASATNQIGNATGYGFSFWVCQDLAPSGVQYVFGQKGTPNAYIRIEATGQLIMEQAGSATSTAVAAIVPSGCETLEDFTHVGIIATATEGTQIYINGVKNVAAGGGNAIAWAAGVQNTLTFGSSPSNPFAGLLEGGIFEFLYFDHVDLTSTEAAGLITIRQLMACHAFGDHDPSIVLAAYADGAFAEPITGGDFACGDVK